jgi:hypothetical protein
MSAVSEPTNSQPSRITLTPAQMKSRRARNIAIGLAIGFLAALFYAVTIVKLGPGILNRPL